MYYKKNTKKMKTIRLTSLLAALILSFFTTLNGAEQPLFNTAEIIDESTLDIKILDDWHPVGSTRQKLIEINVADW